MQRETNLKALHGSAGGGRCISLWDWLCVSICVLCACVCVCLLSTLVTSGVIFLASRRDSEIIRNVNTHWSLYSYEFSVSFSRSLFHLLWLS